MLEIRDLYLAASPISRTILHIGFHGAPFIEPATGLAYFRNRWYDAATGQWLTPDPLLYEDGSNVYAAFALDPVNNRDPLGLESIRQLFGFAEDLEQGRTVAGYSKAWAYSAYNIATFGFVSRHDELNERFAATDDVAAYVTDTGIELGRAGLSIAATYFTAGFGGRASATFGGAIAGGAVSGAGSSLLTTGTADVYDRIAGGAGMTGVD